MLPVSQSCLNETVDDIDDGISHRIATDRQTPSVNHQKTACATMETIEPVRKAQIKRQMMPTVRIEAAKVDFIKSFRCLMVAFPQFGPESSRPPANRPVLQQNPSLAVAHPQLDFRFFLEDPDIDGRTALQTKIMHPALGHIIRSCMFLRSRPLMLAIEQQPRIDHDGHRDDGQGNFSDRLYAHDLPPVHFDPANTLAVVAATLC